MAKYDVTHVCGHSETHTLFGPHKQRDSKLAWLAGTLCSECYQAKQAADREAAAKAAAESNAASGLPGLIGSPKQIAWAETLRSNLVASLMDDVRRYPAAEQERLTGVVLRAVGRQTEARWWIDTKAQARKAIAPDVRSEMIAIGLIKTEG